MDCIFTVINVFSTITVCCVIFFSNVKSLSSDKCSLFYAGLKKISFIEVGQVCFLRCD